VDLHRSLLLELLLLDELSFPFFFLRCSSVEFLLRFCRREPSPRLRPLPLEDRSSLLRDLLRFFPLRFLSARLCSPSLQYGFLR
jgi:hypothetical protein